MSKEVKDYADELVKQFREKTDCIASYNYDAVNINCAIICVERIIEAEPTMQLSSEDSWNIAIDNAKDYYQEALTELKSRL